MILAAGIWTALRDAGLLEQIVAAVVGLAAIVLPTILLAARLAAKLLIARLQQKIAEQAATMQTTANIIEIAGRENTPIRDSAEAIKQSISTALPLGTPAGDDMHAMVKTAERVADRVERTGDVNAALGPTKSVSLTNGAIEP